MRRFLPVVLLCGLPALAEPPTPAEVDHAHKTLLSDLRGETAGALDVLKREGSKDSIELIADFGATTAYPRSAILAGRTLFELGPGIAKTQIRRVLRTQKKKPENLAKIALLAEQLEGKDGLTYLLGLAKDKRDIVASTAVRALGARREEGARDTLRSLLKSSRAAVSTAAAFALSRLKADQPTMEQLFKRVLKASKHRVGDACALALTRLDGAEAFGNRALALLIKRSTHDSFHALVKVAMRLAKEPDPDLLATGLKSPSATVREVCCDIIGLNQVQGFAKTLLRLAVSEHGWRNKVAAWLALRRAGCAEVLDGVRKNVAKAGEPSYWALQCLIKTPHEEALPELRDAALDTKDPVRRELAQIALRHVKRSADATRDFFLEVVRTNRGTKRGWAALMGLGNLKDVPSFHALVGLLEKEKELRHQLPILKGLEKLTGHYYEPNAAIWKDWFQVVGGKVAFDPAPMDRRENRKRIKKVTKLGISAATEKAVENGLLWLSRHQDLDGGWNGSTYHKNCIQKGACAKEGGIRERDLAYTGLALLAYQGAGYSHLHGPYRDIVQRGFEFMLSRQDYDGSHVEKSWTFSYEAAIICQALCDGYALTGDAFLGEGAQRMIDYLVKVQYPGRTWRYRVRSDTTDTSVMSWILTACISARHAGIDMPEQIFVASEVWLNKASDPVPPGEYEVFIPDQFKKDNRYFIDVSRDKRGKIRHYKIKTWYQPPRLYTPAMTAIGLLCRIWLGWTRAHPYCVGSANQVMSQIPGYGTGLEGEFAFYPYTWYYGSLAMYQMGGRYWTRWKNECIADVVKNQKRGGCQAGSWEMPRGQLVAGLTGGTVYCTCMSILTLESFYRYQPYLARFDLRSREDPNEGKEEDGAKQDPAGK